MDLDLARVAEGDSGTRTVDFPVTVTGTGTGAVRLFFIDPDSVTVSSTRVVEVRAGQLTTGVTLPITGDRRYDVDRMYELDVKATSNVLVGSYYGGLVVLNDDPVPPFSLEPVTDRVAEGGTLAWRARMSDTANVPIYLRLLPRAPAEGAELSTTDLDPDWAAAHVPESGEPAKPLSATSLVLTARIDAGKVTADITLPTAADDVTEPVRSVEFEVRVYQGAAGWTSIGTLTGSVTDG